MFHFHNPSYFENTPAPKHLQGTQNANETMHSRSILKDATQGTIRRRFGNDLTNQHSIKPQTLFIDYDFKKINTVLPINNNSSINDDNLKPIDEQKQDCVNENPVNKMNQTTQIDENDEVEYCPPNTSWVPNIDEITNEIDLDHAFQIIGSYRSFISSRNVQDIDFNIPNDDEYFDCIPIKDISSYSPRNLVLENIMQNHCELALDNIHDEFEPFPLLFQFNAEIIEDI